MEIQKIGEVKERALRYALDAIRREAEYLKARAEHILNVVNGDNPYFNSLGELQGNALTLDHAIIKYSNIRATFEEVEGVLKVSQ